MDHHSKTFDDGTQTKLIIYGSYLRAWIKVFTHTRHYEGETLSFFDFFSGPGKDPDGTPGSPAILMDELLQHHEANFNTRQILIPGYKTHLDQLMPRLSTVHVYHWTIGSYEKNVVNETVRPLIWPEDYNRHPLEDGTDRWAEYFSRVSQTGKDHFALLEFVKDKDIGHPNL